MSRRIGWSGWLLLLGLAPQFGCLSQQTFGPELNSSTATSHAAARREVELPADQAAEACLVTARTLEENGHEPEAILEYERARTYNAQVGGVSRRLAVLYDRQGDDARALAEYRQALKFSPRDATLLNDFGYFHYERGNWDEAEKWLRQATAADPNYERAWVNLGLVLGHQGHYEESLQVFTRVLSPAEAKANVGILMALQGESQGACACLREALKSNPNLKQARAVLERLENGPSVNRPGDDSSPKRQREDTHTSPTRQRGDLPISPAPVRDGPPPAGR